MRPAAARALTGTDPGRLVAASEPMPDAPVTAIRAAMHDGRPVGELLHDWLEPVSRQVDASGRLVNTVCRLAEDRDDVIKVEDPGASGRHDAAKPRQDRQIPHRSHSEVAD